MAPPRIAPVPWGLLTLAVVYFVAGKIGLMLPSVHHGVTTVSPPTGIALAALLMLGYRVWPAILLAEFLVAAMTAELSAMSLGIAIGNTLEGLVGCFLVTRFANGRNALDRPWDFIKFAALAAGLSTMVSATVGVTSLALGGYASWSLYGFTWATWWLGDVAGTLVVAPFLILWCGFSDARPDRAGALELTLLFGSSALVGLIVFNGLLSPWVTNYPLAFLCIPPLVWAAFRFGQREAATAIVLMAAIATWGTLWGFGPFVRETHDESLLLLQAFMGTMAMMSLPLAAVAAERARANEALARVAAIVASSDDAIIGETLEGAITSWNLGAERLYGYQAAEVLGRPISMIIPPDLQQDLPRILEGLRRGEQVDHTETVRVGKDGRRIDVSVTVSPTRDAGGRIVGASSIDRDITRVKEAEALQRERDRLRFVANLAAAAAHEINNPLTAVVGQAQFLANEVEARGRHRVGEILDAAWRIQEIVDRMNHINRIELINGSSNLPEMLDLRKSGVANDRETSRTNGC